MPKKPEMMGKKNVTKWSVLLLMPLFLVGVVHAENLAPIHIDRAELQGRNVTEVFDVLKQYHNDAWQKGAELIYPEGMTIQLVIPKDAATLPLPVMTNFNGCRLVVRNVNMPGFCLFSLMNKTGERKIDISCSMINTGDFSGVPALSTGTKLLRIKDKKLWTHRAPEEGDYDIYRQDLLLIKDGKAENSTIFPYNKDTSAPDGYYSTVDDEQKVMCNLTFERSAESTEICNLLICRNQNNILIKNVNVITPFVEKLAASDIHRKHDYCFRILNSANVSFEDVTIRGTYSLENSYGYAVNMDNVLNSSMVRFNGEAHWGVFGNNNLNCAKLKDCRINRFDLHCYGCDVTCEGCVVSNQIDNSHPGKEYSKLNVLNAFGSMYGTLSFTDCRFVECRPIYLRPYYKAYTPFDIVFNRCTFDISLSYPYFVTAGILDEGTNKRPELSLMCWPNVSFSDCLVNLPPRMKELFIFYTYQNSRIPPTISYLSDIRINNLSVSGGVPSPAIHVSRYAVRLSKRLKKKVRKTSFVWDDSMLLR